jgi:hypothetical protein
VVSQPLPPIDVSGFKEATLSFNSPNFSATHVGYTVTITDGIAWTLDKFTVPYNGAVTRHYDYLPTGINITLTTPGTTSPVDWGLALYGRDN